MTYNKFDLNFIYFNIFIFNYYFPYSEFISQILSETIFFETIKLRNIGIIGLTLTQEGETGLME